jgi:rhamnose utilization protein RhaD (predicted bifunctional aldolase and dehydrogenase)
LALTKWLGDPAKDFAIQAEGNTSTRLDADSFVVKASGYSMATIEPAGFVGMYFGGVLELLDGPELSTKDLKAALALARVDPSNNVQPSIEVCLHALLLTLGQANYVGHTHPTAWNSVLCSTVAEQASSGRLFPDHVVVCGPAAMYVPYTDPGVPLAREVRRRLYEYLDRYHTAPKEIVMQNHGLIALGSTAAEVERVTAMSVKAARILVGTYSVSQPNFMSEADIAHIWTRPDEIERRAMLIK